MNYKNIFESNYFSVFTIVLFLFLLACSVKAKNGVVGLSTKDCYPERKSIENKMDVFVSVSDVGDNSILILINDDTQRYIPCNLPKGIKEGDKLKVSFTLKEIQPHERWPGNPCLLTSIDVLK